jgi:hypothetical protein
VVSVEARTAYLSGGSERLTAVICPLSLRDADRAVLERAGGQMADAVAAGDVHQGLALR